MQSIKLQKRCEILITKLVILVEIQHLGRRKTKNTIKLLLSMLNFVTIYGLGSRKARCITQYRYANDYCCSTLCIIYHIECLYTNMVYMTNFKL